MYITQINKMRVIKRNGNYEDVSFDKISNRIRSLSYELNIDINVINQHLLIIFSLFLHCMLCMLILHFSKLFCLLCILESNDQMSVH